MRQGWRIFGADFIFTERSLKSTRSIAPEMRQHLCIFCELKKNYTILVTILRIIVSISNRIKSIAPEMRQYLRNFGAY